MECRTNSGVKEGRKEGRKEGAGGHASANVKQLKGGHRFARRRKEEGENERKGDGWRGGWEVTGVASFRRAV